MSLGIAKDSLRALSHWPAPAKPRTSSSRSAERRSGSGTWSAPPLSPKGWSSTSGRSPCGRGSPSSTAGWEPAGARHAGEPGRGPDLSHIPGTDAASDARAAEDARRPHEAVLAQALEANGPREHYMRAASTWEAGETGRAPLPRPGQLLGGRLRPRRLPHRAPPRRPCSHGWRAGDDYPLGWLIEPSVNPSATRIVEILTLLYVSARDMGSFSLAEHK